MSLFNDERKAISKILSVLEKASVSQNGYDSTMQPFFCKDYDEKFKIEFEGNQKYKEIPKGLNRHIILIYKILGNTTKEIYLGEWTLLSLDKALEQYDDYCKNNRKNVFNVGYKYVGMGHVEVLSCDLDSHLLFLRPDGGSNGYDRLANYNEIINNGPKKYKQFYFSDWFYNIKID